MVNNSGNSASENDLPSTISNNNDEEFPGTIIFNNANPEIIANINETPNQQNIILQVSQISIPFFGNRFSIKTELILEILLYFVFIFILNFRIRLARERYEKVSVNLSF
jgi:hypothetical protein